MKTSHSNAFSSLLPFKKLAVVSINLKLKLLDIFSKYFTKLISIEVLILTKKNKSIKDELLF